MGQLRAAGASELPAGDLVGFDASFRDSGVTVSLLLLSGLKGRSPDAKKPDECFSMDLLQFGFLLLPLGILSF